MHKAVWEKMQSNVSGAAVTHVDVAGSNSSLRVKTQTDGALPGGPVLLNGGSSIGFSIPTRSSDWPSGMESRHDPSVSGEPPLVIRERLHTDQRISSEEFHHPEATSEEALYQQSGDGTLNG